MLCSKWAPARCNSHVGAAIDTCLSGEMGQDGSAAEPLPKVPLLAVLPIEIWHTFVLVLLREQGQVGLLEDLFFHKFAYVHVNLRLVLFHFRVSRRFGLDWLRCVCL